MWFNDTSDGPPISIASLTISSRATILCTNWATSSPAT
jgi:hypothetical protein